MMMTSRDRTALVETDYNKLKRYLDLELGYPNMKDSRLIMRGKYINPKTGAIGTLIAYEVRVDAGSRTPANTRRRDLPMIRELLEVPHSTAELRKVAAKRKGSPAEKVLKTAARNK